MKRRVLLLLAVPVLALGFSLGPGSGTAEAWDGDAMYWSVACSIANGRIAYAVSQGDEASAAELVDIALAAGCSDI